jgi:hypothetical protein
MKISSFLNEKKDPQLNGTPYPQLFFVFFILFSTYYFFRDILVFPPLYVRGVDTIGYFAQLRSLYFDGDLNILSELVAFYGTAWESTFRLNPMGDPGNPWVIGPAILWLPFYAMGHIWIWIFNHFGANYPINGFEFPFQASVCLGTMVYGMVSLVLSFKLASKFFPSLFCLGGTIFVWIGSPFLFYMFILPTMAHVPATFCLSLFLYYQIKSWREKLTRHWLTLGVLAGLAVITRLENGAYLTLVLLEFVLCLKGKDAKNIFKDATAFLAGFFLALAPQMWAWDYYFGSPFKISYGNPIKIPFLQQGDTPFHVSNFSLGKVFISSYSGIIPCSPILIFSLIGLIFWKPREGWFKFGVVLSLIVTIWFTANWDGGMGDTFGYRYLVQSTPVFIIGLSSFFYFFYREKKWGKACLFFSVLLCVWGLLSVLQSAMGVAPSDKPWTWEQIFFDKWKLTVFLCDYAVSKVF